MSQSILDPISFSQSLQNAGMPRQQADLIAQAQEARLDRLVQVRELATKSDLREMELRLTKSFHNAIYGFAGIVIAAVACAVAILK